MANQKSDHARIKEMEVDGFDSFPVSKSANVYTMCNLYKRTLGHLYKTWSADGRIYVKRIQ